MRSIKRASHASALTKSAPKFDECFNAATAAVEKYFAGQTELDHYPGDTDNEESVALTKEALKNYVLLKMVELAGMGGPGFKQFQNESINIRHGSTHGEYRGYRDKIEFHVAYLNDEISAGAKAPQESYSTDEALKRIDAAIENAMGVGKSRA